MATQVKYPDRPATEKQVRFLEKLRAERSIVEPLSDELTAGEASSMIDDLLKSGRDRSQDKPGVTEPGVYERDGEVYVVKPNQAKTALYAKRLVEINGDRLTEADGVVQIEFEYARGAIFRLRPEDKMPLDRAKELTIRYGRCINCGRSLKAAESVERGIGPVCIKSFRAAA